MMPSTNPIPFAATCSWGSAFVFREGLRSDPRSLFCVNRINHRCSESETLRANWVFFTAGNRAPSVTLFKTENTTKSAGSQTPLILAHIHNPRSQERAGIALTGGAPVPTPIELVTRTGRYSNQTCVSYGNRSDGDSTACPTGDMNYSTEAGTTRSVSDYFTTFVCG